MEADDVVGTHAVSNIDPVNHNNSNYCAILCRATKGREARNGVTNNRLVERGSGLGRDLIHPYTDNKKTSTNRTHHLHNTTHRDSRCSKSHVAILPNNPNHRENPPADRKKGTRYIYRWFIASPWITPVPPLLAKYIFLDPVPRFTFPRGSLTVRARRFQRKWSLDDVSPKKN